MDSVDATSFCGDVVVGSTTAVDSVDATSFGGDVVVGSTSAVDSVRRDFFRWRCSRWLYFFC